MWHIEFRPRLYAELLLSHHFIKWIGSRGVVISPGTCLFATFGRVAGGRRMAGGITSKGLFGPQAAITVMFAAD
jgi:hypothetical protein